MNEEPLEEWARRREERRAASKGRLRAAPLTEGWQRAAHVQPDAPRVIQEWNGIEWETIGVVENLKDAKALLYPPQPVQGKPAEWGRPALGPGKGRHRRTAPTEDGR